MPSIAQESNENISVTDTLNGINSEIPGMVRTTNIENLALRLGRCNYNCVSDQDILTMIEMLKDNDDSVRLWTAAMLGDIGYRARNSVNALQAALSERHCDSEMISSSGAIRVALSKLGASPIEGPCP
jgi:hypothetical protein